MPVIKTHFCRHCKTQQVLKMDGPRTYAKFHISHWTKFSGISMRLMTSLKKIHKAALRNIRKTAYVLTKPCVPTTCGNRAISVAICSTR
ncbi:hypothetical protein DPMN_059507 [Dreissena polymorpha]|uniref:Uncharacterized protein n=1 Tax=Dreissena polymorpha TaxID=45954 RepID=A0A9D4HGQ2_DREPO|nr:hypothetical protein DPMN_059507 [Dreissena polymorpha]